MSVTQPVDCGCSAWDMLWRLPIRVSLAGCERLGPRKHKELTVVVSNTNS